MSSLAACERLASRLAEREAALHGACCAMHPGGCELLTPPRCSVLVNNSGVAWGEPLATHSEKGLDRVYALNFKALFFLSRACLRLLDAGSRPGSPARIINIGSIAGIRPQGFPTYGYDASKAAVHHLTQKLADELAVRPNGARCVRSGHDADVQTRL